MYQWSVSMVVVVVVVVAAAAEVQWWVPTHKDSPSACRRMYVRKAFRAAHVEAHRLLCRGVDVDIRGRRGPRVGPALCCCAHCFGRLREQCCECDACDLWAGRNQKNSRRSEPRVYGLDVVVAVVRRSQWK
jgi:hypothetical protein